MSERTERTERAFREALDRGDVGEALVRCPWGYTSRVIGGVFHFKFDGGREARAATLLDAVRAAATPTSGGTP